LYKPKAAKSGEKLSDSKSTKRSTSKTSDQEKSQISKNANPDLKDILSQIDDQDIPFLNQNFLDFNEIRDSLSGIARVIEYTIDASYDEIN